MGPTVINRIATNERLRSVKKHNNNRKDQRPKKTTEEKKEKKRRRCNIRTNPRKKLKKKGTSPPTKLH